jgi:hypothetical protein
MPNYYLNHLKKTSRMHADVMFYSHMIIIIIIIIKILIVIIIIMIIIIITSCIVIETKLACDKQ